VDEKTPQRRGLHRIRFGDILHDHILDLALNISRLIPNRDLGKTRQVDESESEHIRRKYPKINGDRRNACILSCLELGIFDDLGPNLGKV
jgi:hypothetical protein